MFETITTYTKICMSPADPKAEDICIEDIAHALSLMTRANGHLKTFYSVAQHSLNCANEAYARGYSDRVRLACLLHDSSEAYLSDLTRPVKIHLPGYMILEERLQNLVWEVFGLSDLTAEEAEQVKEIDDALLYHEFLVLHNHKVFEAAPALTAEACFAELHFKVFENDFLNLFYKLRGACQ